MRLLSQPAWQCAPVLAQGQQRVGIAAAEGQQRVSIGAAEGQQRGSMGLHSIGSVQTYTWQCAPLLAESELPGACVLSMEWLLRLANVYGLAPMETLSPSWRYCGLQVYI